MTLPRNHKLPYKKLLLQGPRFLHRIALYYMGAREVIPRKDLQLKGPPEDLQECPFCQDIVQQQTTEANGDNDNSDDDNDTLTEDSGTFPRKPRTTRSRQTPEQPLVPLELYMPFSPLHKDPTNILRNR
jgi:hypothetical protein